MSKRMTIMINTNHSESESESDKTEQETSDEVKQKKRRRNLIEVQHQNTSQGWESESDELPLCLHLLIISSPRNVSCQDANFQTSQWKKSTPIFNYSILNLSTSANCKSYFSPGFTSIANSGKGSALSIFTEFDGSLQFQVFLNSHKISLNLWFYLHFSHLIGI